MYEHFMFTCWVDGQAKILKQFAVLYTDRYNHHHGEAVHTLQGQLKSLAIGHTELAVCYLQFKQKAESPICSFNPVV